MHSIVALLLLLHLGALILPGPDFAVTLGYSLIDGRKSAIACAFGITIGVMLNALISFLLSQSLLHHFPLLYISFVLLGLMYLAYSGISLVLDSFKSHIEKEQLLKNKKTAFVKQPLITGIWTNISNVKAIVFFNSTLPLVARLNGAFQLITWIGIGILTALWFSLVATLLSHTKIRTLFLGKIQFVQRIVGSALILFSIGILLGEVC